MRFLGRKSSNNGPKAICRRILNKFNPSADRRSRYGGVEDDEWLAIPTKLINLEDVATSNHMSLVELAMTTVRNRPSKKSRTTLMISDTSVELILNKQNLFAIGLDKVVTCFSLPFEPRAFALVYKKDSAGGYCCACLMLNNALTSLSGWEVWEMLIRKQMFFSLRKMNRRFTAQTQLIGNTFHDTTSMSFLGCSLSSVSCTSIDSLTSSLQPCHGVDSSSLSTLTSVTSGSFGSLCSLDSTDYFNTELEQIFTISSSKLDSILSLSGTSVDSLTSEADSSLTCCSRDVSALEEACLKSDAEASTCVDEEAPKCSGPEPLSSSCIDFTDEAERDGSVVANGSDSPACDEDVDSGTVLLAHSDVPSSPSADSSGTRDALVQTVPSNGDGTKDERLTDSGNASDCETSVTDNCEDIDSQESEPSELNGDTVALEKQTGSADENAVSSESDGSDDVNSDGVIMESESDLCSHDHDESKTDLDDSCSSCSEHTQNSDCDKSKESDGTNSDSDLRGSCSCEENTNGNESNSSGSETESESDSCSSDGSQETTGSESDSHSSCDENAHSSDCDKTDEADSSSRMTDSDSDSCSCSSCCSCSCKECCNHESDSEVCYDSESDSSSDENTTDSDYDGDDEDDDESVKHWKCQPVTRISSQYSNKTVRLIRVQNVGLVVMALSKADQDSVSGRKSVEASSSLQMLKRLGKEISFKRVPC